MAWSDESIETRARALLGGAGETGRLLPLCAAAGAELSRRLRAEAGAVPEETFVTAAALLALSLLAELSGAEGAVSVRAGSVAVEKNAREGAGSAAALRREAEALLAPYLRDGGFEFMGVRG